MSDVRYTDRQFAAIDVARRHLDACVVAGPGSGKTTVLVAHFRRLVEAGVDPLRILAITFTEKAAGNMRKKLAEAFAEQPATRAALERSWVSTVHGFCARLLRENAVFAGVDPEFQVSDERTAWRLQQEAMAGAMDSLFRDRPEELRRLVRGLSSLDFEGAALGAYDAMRGAGVGVEDLARFAPPAGVTLADAARTVEELRRTRLAGWTAAQREHCAAAIEAAERVLAAPDARAALEAIGGVSIKLPQCKKDKGAYELLRRLRDVELEEARYTLLTECYVGERRLLIEILRRFDRLYRERKRQAGVLDFADLEECAVRLLAGAPETRARLQRQFGHVLMDELQDTNGQQARLLGLIRPPGRFYAVGDINQSIFGFRHAEPREFARYRDEVERTGGRLVELIDNFRSRPEILRAVESVLPEGTAGIVPRRLVAGRKFEDERPVSVELMCVLPGETEEAQWVARRTLELLRNEPRFTYQDVAVLVRNTEVLGAFTAAFDAAGIPYVVNRGRGFYDSREVNDLTQLLRVMANPRDEVALAAVLRSPLAAVSDEALLALRIMGENLGGALMRLAPEYAAEFGESDYAALAGFRDRLREWRKQRENVTFDRLLLAAIDDCGYGPATNIEKFLAQAREAALRMSLDEFVEELALVREENPREPDAPPEDSSNAVKLMTVHSAKGLEFPIVFVAALHKGIDNSLPVVAFSPQFGLGARWRLPGGRKEKEKDDLFQHAIRDERKEREEAESHRLLYVAMTRAEEHLALSFSGERPQNWAKVVVAGLGVDVSATRDDVIDFEGWRLRVLVADKGTDAGERIAIVESAAEVELLAAPVAAEQYDSGVAVTSLGTFAVCPRKYALGRGGAETGRNGHGGGKELGIEVHAVLAGMAANPSPEAMRLAGVFERSEIGRRLQSAGRVEREFDFVLAIEDVVVRGQIDLWFEESGELVIVDYKTDAVNGAAAHEKAREYAAQVRLYALAVESVVGRPPDRAWLHFLRPDKLVAVDLRPSLLESPEQIVREFREAQESGEFAMNPGPHCQRCAFYHRSCPAR